MASRRRELEARREHGAAKPGEARSGQRYRDFSGVPHCVGSGARARANARPHRRPRSRRKEPGDGAGGNPVRFHRPHHARRARVRPGGERPPPCTSGCPRSTRCPVSTAGRRSRADNPPSSGRSPRSVEARARAALACSRFCATTARCPAVPRPQRFGSFTRRDSVIVSRVTTALMRHSSDSS